MGSGGEDSDSDGTAALVERWREWFLLDGHRGIVAGATAGLIFAVVLLVSSSGLVPLRSSQPLFYVFSGLISGNLTLITVVVSINQLLLSRELKTPHELRSQIEGTIDYRTDIEDAAGRIAPVEPLGFLRLLVENVRQTAQQLGGLTYTEASETNIEDITGVVSKVTHQADEIDDLLQESDASTFTVLSTTLTTNYARDINDLRRIKENHDLTTDVDEAIDDLVHRLQDFDVARQYLKAIYLQQELALLSRFLFYAGLPSVTVVAVTLTLFTAERGAIVSGLALSVLISAAITVGLFPLVLLFAFIVRTATVTQRTAAVIPFTTPEQEQ